MSRKNSNQLILFLFALLFIGLLYSRVLLSISLGLISLTGLYFLIQNKNRNWKGSTAYFFITGIFLISFLSGINSAETGLYLDKIRVQLPFLILPIPFMFLPLSKRLMSQLLYGFHIGMSLICFYLCVQYALHYQDYKDLYSVGQILPTPIQHIRFSLLVSLSIVSALYLFIHTKTSKLTTFLLLISSSFLAVFLHILAVRTGILAFYSTMILTAIYLMIKYNKKTLGFILLALFPILMVCAYKTIPTIQSKVNYTMYTLKKFNKNENTREYSDSRRLASIYAGIEIGCQYPLFGIGIGDIKSATNDYLKQHHSSLADLNLLPHNQYVYYFAGTGFIGLCFFSLFSIGFLRYLNMYKHYLCLSFFIIFCGSFMVEHTIITQLGVSIYLVFTLFSMRLADTERMANYD